MDAGDILAFLLIFLLVFNYNTVEEIVTEDPNMQTWRKFYRVHGVDRIYAEQMREELIRRGVPDPPNFTLYGGREDPIEVMAKLQTLMQEVPYVKMELDNAFTDKTPSYSSAMVPYPQFPEPDDA